MTPSQIQRLVAWLAFAAAVATAVLILVGARQGRPGGAVATGLILGSMPYAAMLMLGRWSEGIVTAQLAVLAVLVLMVFFAAGIYAQAFWNGPTAESGFAVVLVPLFQSVGVALAGVTVAVLRWRARAEEASRRG